MPTTRELAIPLLYAAGRVAGVWGGGPSCRRVGRVRGDGRDLTGAVRGCLLADAEGAAPGRQGLIGGWMTCGSTRSSEPTRTTLRLAMSTTPAQRRSPGRSRP